MDTSKFMGSDFTRRTEFVPVPELRDFFLDKITEEITRRELPVPLSAPAQAAIEKAVVGFTVQGLTGHEFGQAKAMVRDRKNLMALIDGILSGIPRKITESIRELFGSKAGENVPDDDALALYLFSKGVISPEFAEDERMEIALRMYKFFPIDFQHISNRIIMLTGLGHIPGKPVPSSAQTE